MIDRRTPTNFIDLSGQRFGRLFAIERAPSDKSYRTMWLCRCDCGTVKPISASSLRQQNSKSCGRCPVPRRPCAAPNCTKIAVSDRIKHCRMHHSRLLRGSKRGLAPSAPRICLQCGNTLKITQQTKYCSHQCCVRFLRGTVEVRPCASCGTEFETWEHGIYCSKACKKEGIYAWSHRKRAKIRSAGVEKFTRQEIFERDAWRCQLCGKKTRRDASGRHPLAPSLDHIIPISRGGAHTRRNCQCAHLICNFRKQANIKGQMRLFG